MSTTTKIFYSFTAQEIEMDEMGYVDMSDLIDIETAPSLQDIDASYKVIDILQGTCGEEIYLLEPLADEDILLAYINLGSEILVVADEDGLCVHIEADDLVRVVTEACKMSPDMLKSMYGYPSSREYTSHIDRLRSDIKKTKNVKLNEISLKFFDKLLEIL